MFADINKQLQDVKENLRKKKKYEEHVQRATAVLLEERQKRDQLKTILTKEKEDVARLEGFSLTNIFYTLIGKKLEKLDQEQQEVLSAKLKYKEALQTIEDLEGEIREYKEKLVLVVDADHQYKQLLQKKELLIHDTQSPWSEELFEITEKEAEIFSNIEEYNEAITAGEEAVEMLDLAIKSLDSAKGWSTFDMIGGGMISTAIKHSHLDDAEEHIHQAQKGLRHFQEELADIENHYNGNLDIGAVLTFADYFFDGIIFDWFVHGKIADCYDQTFQTKEDVAALLSKLAHQKKSLQDELALIKNKRTEILESAR
ncbi:hypothetical protein [Bacillus dakarensis]|uniref:hypothetical protein n=1 Tax=Robertmurraya dakarensis TaxID=1926278 RepID=UPI0009821AF0|nr:hypothetical protein [Bacillus dakarensis]